MVGWTINPKTEIKLFLSMASLSLLLQYSVHTDEMPGAFHFRSTNVSFLNLKCHALISCWTTAEVLGSGRPPSTDWYSKQKCPARPVTHKQLYGCKEMLWARLQWNMPILDLFPGSKHYGRHLTTLRSRARILIKSLWAFHPRRVPTLHYQHFANGISTEGWADPVGGTVRLISM